jgi:hypothetical protein
MELIVYFITRLIFINVITRYHVVQNCLLGYTAM